MGKKSKNILFLAQFSMLLAIEAIVCFTPLGSLPAFGPIVATLSAVPVIITAILLGPGAGAAMGGFFGLFSFLVWTFAPPSPITAFVFTPLYSFGEVHGNFWSLVICFVPRILIGLTAGLCFRGFVRKAGDEKEPGMLAYAVSGFAGSMVNTLLVLGGIYIFFGKSYAQAAGLAYEVLLGVIGLSVLTSGIPEAIIGMVAAYAVCRPLRRYLLRHAA